MSKLTMKGYGELSQVSSNLIGWMEGSGVSCQFVGGMYRKNNIMLVFDKYYMRAGNRASLSIMLTKEDDIIYADIVGAGGGQGVFFNFSWGAEGNFVDTARSLLNEMGFVVLETY